MVSFRHLSEHLEAPSQAAPAGRLVLSNLPFGESLIAAHGPSIKFVLEGEEEYEVDGRRLPVHAGQFMLLGSGPPCIAKIRRGRGTLGLCVYLPGPEVAFPGRSMLLPTAGSPLADYLRQQAGRLAADPSQGDAAAGQVVARARALANSLQTTLRAQLDRLEPQKILTRRDLLQRLEVARAILHAHPDQAVPLERLAREAGMSLFHLSRSFRAAYGEPPASYHRRVRLKRAGQSLRGAQISLTEAALAAGYADASAFSHAFRKLFGQPPSSLRDDRSARP